MNNTVEISLTPEIQDKVFDKIKKEFRYIILTFLTNTKLNGEINCIGNNEFRFCKKYKDSPNVLWSSNENVSINTLVLPKYQLILYLSKGHCGYRKYDEVGYYSIVINENIIDNKRLKENIVYENLIAIFNFEVTTTKHFNDLFFFFRENLNETILTLKNLIKE